MIDLIKAALADNVAVVDVAVVVDDENDVDDNDGQHPTYYICIYILSS